MYLRTTHDFNSRDPVYPRIVSGFGSTDRPSSTGHRPLSNRTHYMYPAPPRTTYTCLWWDECDSLLTSEDPFNVSHRESSYPVLEIYPGDKGCPRAFDLIPPVCTVLVTKDTSPTLVGDPRARKHGLFPRVMTHGTILLFKRGATRATSFHPRPGRSTPTHSGQHPTLRGEYG